jgi:putative addiction module killer protein
MTYQIKLLTTADGATPFEEWYRAIRDKTTRVRIRARLDRLVLGNFGDVRPVGSGISELRLQFGPGYRIYFAQADSQLVVLLAAGDKSSQQRDILLAISLWKAYQDDPQRFQQDF